MSNHLTSPTLTTKQLNQIVSLLTPDTKIHQSQSNLILSNDNLLLFISNSYVNHVFINEHITKEEVDKLLKLEERYLLHTNPTTQLSLRNNTIESIVRPLNKHQQDLLSLNTVTTITYDSYHNELVFKSMPTGVDREPNHVDTISRYNPTSTDGLNFNFSVIVNTNSLIIALVTQQLTGDYTFINYDVDNDYIQMDNAYSSLVIHVND